MLTYKLLIATYDFILIWKAFYLKGLVDGLFVVIYYYYNYIMKLQFLPLS